MNKREFVNILSERLEISVDKALVINSIFESKFFISKKNKDIIVEDIVNKLDVSEKDALHIYDEAVNILKSEIKNKLKHPFGKQGLN